MWSKGGRIYARTHAEAEMTTNHPKPRIIDNPDDLLKNGFSQSEIDSIIKGVVISHINLLNRYHIRYCLTYAFIGVLTYILIILEIVIVVFNFISCINYNSLLIVILYVF